MKIKLSKSQWTEYGKKAGWITAQVVADKDDAVYRRRTVKVTMNDGDTITTGINGTKQEIIDYYTKHDFVKQDEKTMHHGVKVEFLN